MNFAITAHLNNKHGAFIRQTIPNGIIISIDCKVQYILKMNLLKPWYNCVRRELRILPCMQFTGDYDEYKSGFQYK